jgi:dienelactone hydrolase
MPPEDSQLKPEVLILHGEADAFVKPEIVAAWKDKMTEKGNKFTFVGYEGARHGFTNPGAGEFGIDNLKYDSAADKDSWQQMQNLFKRIF